MKILQSPASLESLMNHDGPVCFLAGGISGCGPWQDYVIKMLSEQDRDENYLVVNPRRVGDLAKDGSEAAVQINWEALAMKNSDCVAFWFPKETLCPITLFEYGLALGKNEQHIVLGMDPDYQRRFDLEVQTNHYQPRVKPVFTLEAFAKRISETIRVI